MGPVEQHLRGLIELLTYSTLSADRAGRVHRDGCTIELTIGGLLHTAVIDNRDEHDLRLYEGAVTRHLHLEQIEFGEQVDIAERLGATDDETVDVFHDLLDGLHGDVLGRLENAADEIATNQIQCFNEHPITS